VTGAITELVSVGDAGLMGHGSLCNCLWILSKAWLTSCDKEGGTQETRPRRKSSRKCK